MAVVALVRSPSDAGPALLVVVAGVHFGYDWIAQAYPDPAAAARAIYYIARGMEGAILYAVIWRFAPRSLCLGVACLWGCAENAQTAICRAAIGIGGLPPSVDAFRGLCDLAAGLNGYVVTSIGVLVALAIWQEAQRGKTTNRRGSDERRRKGEG